MADVLDTGHICFHRPRARLDEAGRLGDILKPERDQHSLEPPFEGERR